MKRTIAALAICAMLGISGIASARTIVVMPKNWSVNGGTATSLAQIIGSLSSYATCVYDVKQWYQVDTTVARTGYLRDTLTHTGVQYDAGIAIWDNSVAGTGANDLGGIMQATRWPSIPWLMIGDNAINGFSKWTDRGSPCACGDTTGMANNNNPNAETPYIYRYFDPATGLSWSSLFGQHPAWRSANASRAGWVHRDMLSVLQSTVQVDFGVAGMAQFREAVATRAANSDTTAFWAIYPYGWGKQGWPNGPPTPSPITFLHPSSQYAYGGDQGLYLAAIAQLDSFANQKVLGAAAAPVRYWISLNTFFAGSDSTVAAATLMSGMNINDMDRQNGSADSLGATGLYFTAGVQTDSAADYRWQAAILKKLGGHLALTPMNWGPGRATMRTNLVPPGATKLPWPCAAGDSSCYCVAVRALAVRDSIAQITGCSADNTFIGAAGDWARLITRGGTRTADSLAWVLYMAGYRAIAVNPLKWYATDGAGECPSCAGPWSSPTTSAGYMAIWDSAGATVGPRRLIYKMPLMPFRNHEYVGSTVMMPTAGHDFVTEFLQARFVAPWYFPTPGAFYQHDFLTKLYGIQFPLSGLGGGGANNAPGNRPSWWMIRRIWAEQTFINNHAGRTILTSDFAGNVASKTTIQ